MTREPHIFDGPEKPPSSGPSDPRRRTERRRCPTCDVEWTADVHDTAGWHCFECDAIGYRTAGTNPKT